MAQQLPASSDRAEGERIVAGLSQNRVAITANFDGSEILIYGAVKRDAPAPKGSQLDVIVTVEGPPVATDRAQEGPAFWHLGECR